MVSGSSKDTEQTVVLNFANYTSSEIPLVIEWLCKNRPKLPYPVTTSITVKLKTLGV